MRRVLTLAVLAAISLFAFGGVAQAQPPEETTTPPEFAPPGPGPVTDTNSAAAFAERYAARNAGRFLRVSPRRVRVVDANAVCLQHPVILTRFGCVFTLRALVIQRRRGWHGYPHASKTGNPPEHRRNRIRRYGCLGALTINGGPAVTPVASVRFIDCVRVPRGDYTAPEPVA